MALGVASRDPKHYWRSLPVEAAIFAGASHPMLSNVLQFCGGLVLLLVGGRLLVAASVDTAKRMRVSPLVVGLTLVAWGTSAPELALNLISASKGRGNLALGNIVGANICNMALVLGLCALIKPLVVQERLIRLEIWLNAGILGFMAVLGVTGGFQTWEAGLMLGVFGGYSMWTIMAALRQTDAAPSPHAADTLGDDPTREQAPMGWMMIGACFVGGLALLSFGGSLASDGASGMALALGVPAAIVGVTVVSIGTTLPEMVTGVMAVRKGQTDLAMGNALGSCLFNAGAIFGIVGLVAPPARDGALMLPLAYMGILAIALVPISRTFGKTVSRLEGALLLTSYGAFLAVSAVSAARSA
ncbi:MAG: K+-dependent Na+/Ca+ exchanger [Phycisphaerae bacterium]